MESLIEYYSSQHGDALILSLSPCIILRPS